MGNFTAFDIPNKKPSELSSVTTIANSDTLLVSVPSVGLKTITWSAFLTELGVDFPLGSAAPNDAQYVTLATDADLTVERVLTGTSNQITVTDNGAGSTVVLSTPQDLATNSSVTFGSVSAIRASASNASLIAQNSNVATSSLCAEYRGPNPASAGDSDEAYISYKLKDSTAAQVEFARMVWVANDVTDGTKDGEIQFWVMVNDTLTQQLTINESGVSLALSNAFVTIGNDATLTGERALTGTSNQITVTDNGANSTVVLSTPQDIATTSSVSFGDATLSGAARPLTAQNTTDSASTQVGLFRGGNRATALDNDEAFFSFTLDDDLGVQAEFFRLTWKALDVTNDSKDGQLEIEVQVADTLTTVLLIDGTEINLGSPTNFTSDAYFDAVNNTISANAATITLSSANHQTVDLSAATGAVTLTLDAPNGPSSGTLRILQDSTARDITWVAGTGITTGHWMGTEPTWSGDTGSTNRVVSWVFDGTNIFLVASESQSATF